MFKRMDLSAKDLIESIVQLAFYMNGGIQYDELMWRTPLERDIMENFLLKRMEKAKTTAKHLK